MDWFDVVAGHHPDQVAVKIIDEDGIETTRTYGELAVRFDQVAAWLVGRSMQRATA